ncbi:hypothetical protein GUITHDRAFT_133804 [Guillardia theta CCMP2712]|uniref:F-box/LRR-repeat protein 15-like leucin rich repeat domain-containing protein n=1 Tax=Guillardia theta (strain CCMP2712) TaxID=905079 RepID=L1JUQ5_GUITC|nr:hypothetical protein GUITHDRAFT_133804 [Guillardia theta CCMP2712]EKX52059.1 hypothetical protein GUITHDRAFT_133804 [Guillardia theta CCMP2712]|eukprot:XP_005839039.1 hypothetical protein GUITHDRAFT_133804 [Guillardia theta CCMP2712]
MLFAVIDGIEFVRLVYKTRRVSIVYVAPDGSYLRSTGDVGAYLEKAGITRPQSELDGTFVFDPEVPNENDTTSTKDDSRSASDTPVKETRAKRRNLSLSEGSQGGSEKTAKTGEGNLPMGTTSRSSRESSAPANRTPAVEPDQGGATALGKRRNREIAESRAAAFARGQGFKDDEGRDTESRRSARGGRRERREEVQNNDQEGEAAAPETTNRESWPGPWSTASELYERRSAVAEALKTANNQTEKLVSWTPKANRCSKVVEAATHIEACLEFGLGSILPEMKAKICELLGKKRKLSPEILPIFTDKETSILALPDCSKIGEGDLEKAFERCQGSELEVLNLVYCGRALSDRLLEKVCKNSLNLHTLILGGCYRLSDAGISSAVKALPRLRVLELSDCLNISICALRSISSLADTLESLSLKNSSQLDAEAFLQLGALKNLKRLNLSGCRGLSDTIVELIADSCGETLTELDLSFLPDSGFSAEPVSCKMTDASLSYLGRKCRKLTRLVLRNVETISDEGVKELCQGCPHLLELDFSRCKCIGDEGVQAIASRCCSLTRLTLNSAGSTILDEDSQVTTYSITDASLLALHQHSTKTLEYLDMSWCRGITDEGLGNLVDEAHNLRELYLRGCAQITDIFLNGHSNPQGQRLGQELRDRQEE